ncbi:MAG: helix-turn-helix domain-containing protein [Nanoarchaeota archaeon]
MSNSILKKELVDKVKQNFDLNIYESKVWLALLTKGVASIAEINDLSKVPRSRIYDVLKSLETKGFCMERLGKPIKYLALEPEVVVERLKKSIESTAKERTEILEKVKKSNEYVELEKLFKTNISPVETFGSVLKGRNSVLAQMANLIKDAKKTVVVVSNSDALEKNILYLAPVLKKKASQGVDIKIGVAGNSNSYPEVLDDLRKKYKITVKNIDGNPKFCVADSSVVLVTHSDKDDDTALWIKSEYFANTLAHLVGLN